MDKRLSQPIAQDHSSVRLGLRILNAENKALLRRKSLPSLMGGRSYHVPSEEDEPVPVPKAMRFGPRRTATAAELLAFLQSAGHHVVGGCVENRPVARLNDIPQQHRPAAQTLDAHANLFRLSPDVKANCGAHRKGFTSTVKICRHAEDLFIQQTRSTLGDVGALALHGAAQTGKVLHHIFTPTLDQRVHGF